MSTYHVEQAANFVPPRRGAVLALAVDATARPYDMGSLAIGGFTPDAGFARKSEVIITLQARGARVFFQTSSATASDLDDTAAVAAGGTLAFANTYGAWIEDGQALSLTFNRKLDRFLIVKTASGTATLSIWGSSEAREG